MKIKYFISFLLSVLLVVPMFGQVEMDQTSTDPSRFDFGRMWTFEHAPIDYFEETYDFRPSEEWLEDARKSALRFSTFCSASFISPKGLIMTNHHCSRSLITQLQQEGENLDSTGFYAETYEDERKATGLFVEQLHELKDITSEIEDAIADAETDEERDSLRQVTISSIKDEYSEKEDWEDLRLQVVTYYEGGRFSLYGYKRYDDIRLVLAPEGPLGFFGGDPDNFTYPRYNLDFTLWRAYNDDGEPVNSSEHYFEFNPSGVEKNTPVFVIGNPGSTERYRTMAQLAYDRDIRYPLLLEMLKARKQVLEMRYEETGDPSIQNTIFSFSNSIKAISGILSGLKNEQLFERKANMQEIIRSKALEEGSQDYWSEIEEAYDVIRKQGSEIRLLQPSRLTGPAISAAHRLYDYREKMLSDTMDDQLSGTRSELINMASDLKSESAEIMLTSVLKNLQEYSDPGDEYVEEILDGRSPEQAAEEILNETALTDQEKAQKLLESKKKVKKAKDPLLHFATKVVPEYRDARSTYQEQSSKVQPLKEKVAYQTFQHFGSSLPPDATFTLRISDGVVKGYPYNGTRAPIHTTYYGMYDRHYSHGKEFPWNLPEWWMDPPRELLKAPLNFVSTNDIIGGNSGSPIINKDQEVLGVIFDGNIESLPGNFIFEPSVNRSVSVHAGGILASMKHIYNAGRIIEEITEPEEMMDE